ncbi:MAG: nuclear transport factor 2 family protein [Actinobacteria bacterium]|nr:nuclear transport factor 2 family protein [Actinomycetota bacterium]
MMPRMDDARDYVAVARLQAAYGDAVTRRAWYELVPMFLPDCLVRLDLRTGAVSEHVGPEAIGRLIASSIERFEFFAFTIVNTVVDVAPDGVSASGRCYIRELRQDRADQRWSTAYGLYRDTYRRDGDRWRFATRDYSSLARTSAEGDGMDVFPIPGR